MSLRSATALRPAATSRFVAALGVSAVLHLAMPIFVGGGGARTSRVPIATATLSVRVMPQLEPQVAQPVVAPVVVEEPAKARQRVEKPEREPVRRTDSSASQPPTRAASGVPEGPDLTYYAARQLDVYPKLLGELDLGYRGKAATDGTKGRALLLVLIDEIGIVRDVSVVEAEPANLFEADAQLPLMDARFAPAYRNGRAVRSRVLIAVNYGVERGSP